MKFIKKHAAVFALIGAIIFAVTCFVVVSLASTTKPGASEGPTAPQTASPKPTRTPDTTLPNAGGEEDEGLKNQDCAVLMPAGEYTAMVGRIVKYEGLRLEPTSLEQSQQLSLLTTANYQSTHTGDSSATSSDAHIVTELETDQGKTKQKTTSVTCRVVSDGRAVVLVNPYITTYEIDASGQKIQLNFDFATPAHYSGWVKQGTDWFVDSEN